MLRTRPAALEVVVDDADADRVREPAAVQISLVSGDTLAVSALDPDLWSRLVDAEGLDQCFGAADHVESRGIPFVVARHQLDGVREALAVPAHVSVLHTDARSRPATEQALVDLVRVAVDRLRQA